VPAMQQIVDWLKKLGMSEYAQRFADNDIDASVLPELTDQDLKELGVSLGHRRQILRAIRDLGNASVAATSPSASVETERTRQDDAEHGRARQHHRSATDVALARRGGGALSLICGCAGWGDRRWHCHQRVRPGTDSGGTCDR
jgi:SAM domain (Sterile alpha motif)